MHELAGLMMSMMVGLVFAVYNTTMLNHSHSHFFFLVEKLHYNLFALCVCVCMCVVHVANLVFFLCLVLFIIVFPLYIFCLVATSCLISIYVQYSG